MKFVKESLIRATPERVFAFHEQPGALDLLIPPWEPSRVLKRAENLLPGTETHVEARILGLVKSRWVARHTAYESPRLFEDVMISGPMRSWRHRHMVLPHAEGAILRDEIDYEPPLGPLGRLCAPLLIGPRLRRLFDYRHEVTRRWCEAGEAAGGREPGGAV